MKEEIADEQSEVKLVKLLSYKYFEQESEELRQQTPTSDPLDVSSVPDLDEAWFSGLPPDELELIKENSKRVRSTSLSLYCTVCEKSLHSHHRVNLHRSFYK